MADNLIDKGLDEIAKIKGIGKRSGRGFRRGGSGGARGANNNGATSRGGGVRFNRGFGRRQNTGSIQKRRSGGSFGMNASFSPNKAAAAVCLFFIIN
jgi:hypothetical protein